MASTFTFNDAWQMSRISHKVGSEAAIWQYATSNAISKMWNAYDWRGTVSPLAPFWLVPAQQDYGAPFYSVPANFYGLREVYLVSVANNNVPIRSPLQVVENLEETSALWLPNAICYRASIRGFRIHPAANYGAASPLYLIDGTYKIRPPKITQSMSATTLLWDDVYFNTFVQALSWAILSAAGSRKEAVEQDMVFKKTLMEDTGYENRELGDPIIHPTEPLVGPTGSYGPGFGSWGGY